MNNGRCKRNKIKHEWRKLLPPTFIVSILHWYQQIVNYFLWEGRRDLQFDGGIATDAKL